ncbi:MAG: hypothetical protein ACI8ZN_000051 [Bacteroidia bacterium]|jgi:hypothetical protein
MISTNLKLVFITTAFLMVNLGAFAFQDTILVERAPAYFRLSSGSKFYKKPQFQIESGKAQLWSNSTKASPFLGLGFDFVLFEKSKWTNTWLLRTDLGVTAYRYEMFGSLDRDEFSLDDDVRWSLSSTLPSWEAGASLLRQQVWREKSRIYFGLGITAQSIEFDKIDLNASAVVIRNGVPKHESIISHGFNGGFETNPRSKSFNTIIRVGISHVLPNQNQLQFGLRIVPANNDPVTESFDINLGPSANIALSKSYFGFEMSYSFNYNYKEFR